MIALIAHDAQKDALLEFVKAHVEFFGKHELDFTTSQIQRPCTDELAYGSTKCKQQKTDRSHNAQMQNQD